MFKHYPGNHLGSANHGWLKSKHHFSFAHYYNPKRMGFGVLRVVNDDWVEPGKGFDPHPHRNMEIISYVRTGAIAHKDSVGNSGVTAEGEIQVMSAGSGIVHSEYNLSDSPLTFYQIWIETNQTNVTPRWDSKVFPKAIVNNSLPLLVSGYAEDEGKALYIHQQARIYGGRLNKGDEIEHTITHQAYVLASNGVFEINSQAADQHITMHKGDGAEITDTAIITIKALSESEMVIIDVPPKG